MRFLSLFSGIGGFDLGLERAGMECAGQVEINEFCIKVLEKHWPNVKRMGDIKDVKGNEFGTVDVVVGGVPCQPASVAGKRKGTADDRWLWPQAFRIVEAVKPTWCLFENVSGLLTLENGLVFENLLLELESKGYEVQSFIIPACAVGAWHRRDRIWIVAHSKSKGLEGGIGGKGKTLSGLRQSNPWAENWIEVATRLCGSNDGVPNRVDRLKSLGNAVVPQIPEIIGRMIIDTVKRGE